MAKEEKKLTVTKERLTDPLLVLVAFGLLLLLASLGIFNPLVIGLTGVVIVFLMFIEPYFEKIGLIQNTEQRFLYTILILFFGLFLFGGISSGKIPILAISSIGLLNLTVTMLIYLVAIITIVSLLLCYLTKTGPFKV